MDVLTDDMREIVDAARLCFVATVCADSEPDLERARRAVYQGDATATRSTGAGE